MPPGVPKRSCFVTIGATATFDSLITAALQPNFLCALRDHGFTNLLIQYGKGRSAYEEFENVFPAGCDTRCGINIQGFDFNPQGLRTEMLIAKGAKRESLKDVREGVVISHAGAGSILDALRINAPLIVVPNPELLDNHQVELAEELAAQGYVTHAQTGNLAAALDDSEALKQRSKSWPPEDREAHQSGRGLAGVMDDEMGFLD